MAKVPYEAFPSVQPTTQGPGGLRINTPVSAFGGAEAESLANVGKAMEHVGNEIFARAVALQELSNQTEADEADVKFMRVAGDLHAKYKSLSEQDAVAAYPRFTEDLEKARSEIGASLSSDAARRVFDRSSRGTMGRTFFNAAEYAGQQQRKWMIDTAKSQIELDTQTVSDNPTDDVLFQEKLKRVTDSAKHLAAIQGVGANSPQEQELVLSAKSKLWSQRILGLSRTAPFEAGKMLSEHATEMTESDRLKVDASVRSSARAIGSANIANAVWNEMRGDDEKPSKSLEEMEAEVRSRAKAFDKNDPILAEHSVQRLYGLWQDKKRIEKTELAENSQIVSDAIQRGARDVRELRLDPKVSAAIDALPAKEREGLPSRINRYNAAKDRADNEEIFYKLKGMATTATQDFVDLDFTDAKFKLSPKQIDELSRIKYKIMQVPTADPRLERAARWVQKAYGPEMEALGIYSRTRQNKEDYDNFTGALLQAIDVWQEANKKPPSYEDVVTKIAPQVLKTHKEPAWFGLTTSDVPSFKTTVPEAWKEQAIREVVAGGLQPPSEEALRRAYLREQYRTLFGKPKMNSQTDSTVSPPMSK